MGVYHSGHKVKCSHSNADILVIYAGENRVLVLCNKLRVGGDDLDHRHKRNILHCNHNSKFVIAHDDRTHTILVCIFDERRQLGDAGLSKRVSSGAFEHAPNDAGMHAFIEERYCGGGGYEVGNRTLELLDETRFKRGQRTKLDHDYEMQVSNSGGEGHVRALQS